MQSIYLANIPKSIQYLMKNKFKADNLNYYPENIIFHYYHKELALFFRKALFKKITFSKKIKLIYLNTNGQQEHSLTLSN